MAAGGGGADHSGGDDGVERVLELVDPTKEKRRPDDQLPEEIVLDRPSIVIGRGQRADVRLVQGEGAQNTISRKHAQLRIEGNGAVKLEDLGALNGVFVNRIKVLTATLQPNDLVQFGGAAGLKAGDTLAAPPPSTADAGNAIVYRFVVRPKEQLQGQGQEGAGSGRKRPAAATNGHAAATPGVPAAVDGGGDAAASSDAKRRRVLQEEDAQGEGNGGAKGATTRLKEEVKELRGALAGATQGAEAIFKALGMAPGAGLGQAAKAVERAMAALAKAEGEKGSGKQGAKQEAAELRKWKEKAESLTQHLKARDAELLAAEAKAEALEETGKQAINRVQALEGELQQQKSTLASQLAGSEKENAALKAQLDEVTAQRRSLQEEVGKAHALAAAATATSTSANPSSSTSSSGTSKEAVLMKEIRPELSCALCAGLLMDAAVLPCSHAFCFACLHPKLSDAEKGKGKGKKGGGCGACPICREAIPAGARPYRSTHLDTVVAIVAEALPAQERGEWEKREAATQAYYEKHGGERGVCYGEKGEEAGDEGEGKEMGASAISPSQKPVAGGVGAGKWKKGEAMSEGCNGRGHDYEDCPHRKDGGYGGEEEEEDEDGAGYGEEDEEDEEDGEEEDDDVDNSSGRVGW